jgi:16S rRNA (guanine527-N7)-methyltransferase
MQGLISNILQDPRLVLPKEHVSALTVSRIDQYLQLLVKWNRKINLTAQKEPQEILYRHVFDSLLYLRVITSGLRVMDIGSGAGFPGIPLKIIYPDLELVMVESQRKRCSFLETVVRDLSLKQVEVINSRAEDVLASYSGQFDAIVFRAVSSIEACLDLGARFVAPRGWIVLKKGPEEDLLKLRTYSGFELFKEETIVSYHGLVSSLLVFQKCST